MYKFTIPKNVLNSFNFFSQKEHLQVHESSLFLCKQEFVAKTISLFRNWNHWSFVFLVIRKGRFPWVNLKLSTRVFSFTISLRNKVWVFWILRGYLRGRHFECCLEIWNIKADALADAFFSFKKAFRDLFKKLFCNIYDRKCFCNSFSISDMPLIFPFYGEIKCVIYSAIPCNLWYCLHQSHITDRNDMHRADSSLNL